MVLLPGPHVVCGFYLDYECAWSLLGGAGVLASPFQAMHGLASPLTAAYGSASVGGRHPSIPLHHHHNPFRKERSSKKKKSYCFGFLLPSDSSISLFSTISLTGANTKFQPNPPLSKSCPFFLFWDVFELFSIYLSGYSDWHLGVARIFVFYTPSLSHNIHFISRTQVWECCPSSCVRFGFFITAFVFSLSAC